MTMDKEQFKEKVFRKMHEKGYADHKTDEEIRQAIQEYDDIIDSGMSWGDQYGEDHGVRYAADNISMCI